MSTQSWFGQRCFCYFTATCTAVLATALSCANSLIVVQTNLLRQVDSVRWVGTGDVTKQQRWSPLRCTVADIPCHHVSYSKETTCFSNQNHSFQNAFGPGSRHLPRGNVIMGEITVTVGIPHTCCHYIHSTLTNSILQMPRRPDCDSYAVHMCIPLGCVGN